MRFSAWALLLLAGIILPSAGGCRSTHDGPAEAEHDLVGLVSSAWGWNYVRVVRNYVEGTSRYELFEVPPDHGRVAPVWPPLSILEADREMKAVLRARSGTKLSGGDLSPPPEMIAVCNGGRGFAVVPHMENAGRDDAVVFLTGTGEVLWRVHLADIGLDHESLGYSTDGVTWCSELRVDDDREEIVVRSLAGSVHRLSLADGKAVGSR